MPAGLKQRKVLVVQWETLDTAEVFVPQTSSLSDFRSSLSKYFTMPSKFCIYHLPGGGLWEKDKIMISSDDLFASIVNKIQCESNEAEPSTLYIDAERVLTGQPMMSYSAALNTFLDKPIMTPTSAAVRSTTAKNFQPPPMMNTNTRLPAANFKEDGPSARDVSTRGLKTTRSISAMGGKSFRSASGGGGGGGQEPDFFELVLQRDDSKCVFCRDTCNVVAVHVLDWDQLFDQERLATMGVRAWNDVKNGITLCAPCNEVFHQHLLLIEATTDSDATVRAKKALLEDPKYRDRWSRLDCTLLKIPKNVAQVEQWPTVELFKHHAALHKEVVEDVPPPSHHIFLSYLLRSCCPCCLSAAAGPAVGQVQLFTTPPHTLHMQPQGLRYQQNTALHAQLAHPGTVITSITSNTTTNNNINNSSRSDSNNINNRGSPDKLKSNPNPMPFEPIPSDAESRSVSIRDTFREDVSIRKINDDNDNEIMSFQSLSQG